MGGPEETRATPIVRDETTLVGKMRRPSQDENPIVRRVTTWLSNLLSLSQGVLLLCAIDLVTSAFQVLVACTLAVDFQYVQWISGMKLLSGPKLGLIVAGMAAAV